MRKQYSNASNRDLYLLFFSIFSFAIFPFTTINAQWSLTGMASGNINTVFANGNTIYAGLNATGSLIVSTDQGVNFNYDATGLVSGSDVRAFAANSTDVFTGTTNGVYRTSATGTINWVKVLDNVSCFALYVNGNTVFAGTMGGGVYRSTDNGNSWTQVNNGLTMLHVYALTANSNYLFAGTYHDGNVSGQGVFRSSDNGQTWTAVNNGMSPTTTIMALAVKDNFVFAGTNGQGVYRSSDNGDNWTNVAAGVSHTLHVTCAKDIYVGNLSHGGIAHSGDNGNNWVSVNGGLPNTGGFTVMSLSSNSNYLFAATLGGGISRMAIECASEPNACINWSLLSSTNLTSTTGNIGGTPEVIQGMTVFPNNPYTANGQQLWMGNSGWPAGGMNLNRYVEFNTTATSGNNFTVESVSFKYGDNTLTTNMNLLKSHVYYSTDNWATSNALTTTPLDYLNTTMQTFTATGINAVIASGQVFSVRIYPFTPNGSMAMTPTFAVHNSMAICGTTNTVAAQTATLKIVKDAVPDDPQDFFFLFGNSGGTFVLDDDGGTDATYLNHTTLAGISTGMWTISENEVQGWTLTGISCDPSLYHYVDMATRSVVVYLQAGANVVCTFTNTFNIVSALPATLVDDGGLQAIEQNTPNPFAYSSTISYNIPRSGHVSIRVYNTLGETVRVLVDEIKTAGRGSVDIHAEGLSNGIYFYSIQAEGITQTKKMMVMQ